MRTEEVDITGLISSKINLYETYKCKIINKEGKVFLQLKIGDLQELKED